MAISLHSKSPLNNLIKLLNRGLEEYQYSCYQLYFQKKNSSYTFVDGVDSYWTRKKISKKTLFDIGSITKTLLTTSIVARMVDRNLLSVFDSLDKYLPHFPKDFTKNCQIIHLLNHCSGLVGWAPIYLSKEKRVEKWFVKNYKKIHIYKIGHKTEYSDIGFLVLGEVLKTFGSLESLFKTEVATPLKLKNTVFCPNKNLSIAATEFSIEENKLIHKVVFDENSRYLGGKTSHAGLFSNTSDLKRWISECLRAYSGQSHWLSKKTASLFFTKQALIPKSTWALGFDTPSQKNSTAGNHFSKKSIGTLGYPGCSIWCDLEKELFVILLSNRIHPTRYDERFRKLRPQIHDEVVKFLNTYEK